MDSSAGAANEPTAKTELTITMLHPQDLDPAHMTDADVVNHLSIGSFVGQRTSITTSALSDNEVAPELEALGCSPTHFEVKGPFVEPRNEA